MKSFSHSRLTLPWIVAWMAMVVSSPFLNADDSQIDLSFQWIEVELTDWNDLLMQQQLPFHGRSSDLVFPQKLHRLLTASEQDAELARIVSWRVHGRAFAVHDRKRFLKEILPE